MALNEIMGSSFFSTFLLFLKISQMPLASLPRDFKAILKILQKIEIIHLCAEGY